MEIRCDRCGAAVAAIQPETVRDGEIEYTFFRCPDCGEAYPICATDAALRKSIAEYSRMRQTIRTKPVKEAFIRRAETQKKKNLKRTRELMEQHPLAPLLLDRSAKEAEG